MPENYLKNHFNSACKFEKESVDEKDPTYQLKRYVFEESGYLQDKVMEIMKPHIYDNFAYQFSQYDYRYRSSYVYRNTESDFDANYHSDMKGGTFNGNFMNAIIYMNPNNDWEGGEFGYKDYELDCMVKAEHNMCIIIPAGLRHKIYPVTKGIRRSINLEFRIKL